MEIHCIIVEDEQPAIDLLYSYIRRTDFLKLDGIYGDPVNVLPVLAEQKVDLIFLDMNLPRMSGLDFIRNTNPNASIIITTAYAEYAVSSFELEVVDYLLKPFSYDRFLKAVNRFLRLRQQEQFAISERMEKPERAFMFLKANKKMVKVFLDEILYFEAQKNYLSIVTINECLLSYQSISSMSERLPNGLFLRIHRSFIVARDKITQFQQDIVTVSKKEIRIGKNTRYLQRTY